SRSDAVSSRATARSRLICSSLKPSRFFNSVWKAASTKNASRTGSVMERESVSFDGAGVGVNVGASAGDGVTGPAVVSVGAVEHAFQLIGSVTTSASMNIRVSLRIFNLHFPVPTAPRKASFQGDERSNG